MLDNLASIALQKHSLDIIGVFYQINHDLVVFGFIITTECAQSFDEFNR